MKHWRRKFIMQNGDVMVRYTGMFQCVCGGRVPFIDCFYVRDLLDHLRGRPADLRRLVRYQRRTSLENLEAFALNSELCHDDRKGESHGTHVST